MKKNKKGLSKFVDGYILCGKCGIFFESKVPYFINISSNPELIDKIKDGSIFLSKCSYCATNAPAPISFLFHNPDESEIICFMFEESLTQYSLVNHTVNELFSNYQATLPNSYTYKLRIEDVRIAPTVMILFQKYGIYHKSSFSDGFIHFTPLPELTLYKMTTKDYKNIDLLEIGIAPNNYPQIFDTIIEETKLRLIEKGLFFKVTDGPIERKPIGTYGAVEFLMYLGSTIVLPLVLGVIGSVIGNLITSPKNKKDWLDKISRDFKTGKNKLPYSDKHIERYVKFLSQHLSENEDINISFKISNVENKIKFSGRAKDVIAAMEEERIKLLKSIIIPGDCHFAGYKSGIIIDSILDFIAEPDEFEEIASSHLPKTTTLRILRYEDERIIRMCFRKCRIARGFMKEKNYDEAIKVMQPLLALGEKVTIELLYNYAICLEMLEEEEAFLEFAEEIIRKSLNLPQLKDYKKLMLTYFDGVSKEDVSKIQMLANKYQNNIDFLTMADAFWEEEFKEHMPKEVEEIYEYLHLFNKDERNKMLNNIKD